MSKTLANERNVQNELLFGSLSLTAMVSLDIETVFTLRSSVFIPVHLGEEAKRPS